MPKVATVVVMAEVVGMRMAAAQTGQSFPGPPPSAAATTLRSWRSGPIGCSAK
jgi:hypothetical protein